MTETLSQHAYILIYFYFDLMQETQNPLNY